jgi:hypothetical protein
MSKRISEKMERTRICCGCGKEIKEADIWYPFFDGSRCGGGILYYHAHCAVEYMLNNIGNDKENIMNLVAEAEKDKDEPLCDGLMNFYGVFPISPIHWAKFYALEDDEKEILRIAEEIKNQSKDKGNKQK